jgi:hypothetical protein
MLTDRMHEAASLIQRLKTVDSVLATRSLHNQVSGSAWGDAEKLLYQEVSDVILRVGVICGGSPGYC